MARVLFIETNLRNEKLGIMYVSAALKRNGHATMLCWYEKDDIDEVIKSFAPNFLAFSLLTGFHQQQINIAVKLKNKYNLKVVFGGPHATFFSKEIPDNAADFIVVGHGENAILDVVEGRATEKVLVHDFDNLDLIPFPDRSLFYRFKEFKDNPMKNIITSRDCPHSCSYCYNHSWKKMFKNQKYFMQKRSVDNVIQEAKELKQKYLLEKILFIDDNFIITEKWIKEFCQKYKREIDLPFLCSFRVDMLNDEKLRWLKDAGLFMVNFALESADPTVQKDVLNRGSIKNEHVIKAIRLFKKYGIKTRMQNMIGLPLKESFNDAINTLKFNKHYKVDDSWVSIFQPYPNTNLARYAVENGFVNGDIKKSIAESFFDETLLKIDNKEKIKRLQKWWYFIVKYDFSNKLVDILLEIDFEKCVEDSLLDLRYKFSKKYLYDLNKSNSDDGKLINHDWDEIEIKFASSPNLIIWQNIIKKYRICVGLCDIMMKLSLSQKISKELNSL